MNDQTVNVLRRYFAAGVHGTDDYNMQRLLEELAAAGLTIAPANDDVRFSEIVAAYERGAAWSTENTECATFVKKAARDYADKVTSPVAP